MTQRAATPFAAWAACAFAATAPGLLPAGAGAFDAHAALAWVALVAAPLGALAGACARPLVAGAGVAAALVAAILLAVGYGERGVPAPLGAAAALLALAAFGHAAGRLCARGSERSRGLPVAAALLLLSALLAGLPGRGGLVEAGFAERHPAVGAALLDFSPLTFVFECGGVDWQRHPAVYGPAGTDWFSGWRRPYGARVAAPAALVLGCAAAAAAWALSRRKPRAAPRHS